MHEPSLLTLADLPFHVMGRHPKPLLVGRCVAGVVQGVSSHELFERVRDLALGLRAIGVEAGDRVAIMAESRPEWLMADLAILAGGAVTVPVYSTLPAAQARHILQDSGARVAIVSTAEQLAKVQDARHQLAALEAVVVFDDAAQTGSPSVLTFAQLERRGHDRMVAEWGTAREFRDAARAVTPGQLATIIYTSGTTGEPKGVMLTHGNLVANLMAGARVLGVGPDDVGLSFLPLSHGFERMVSYIYLAAGVTMIFAEAMDTAGRDVATVRPTVMTGVPRAYEKMQARILAKGAELTGLRRRIFFWGLEAGLARARAEVRGRRPNPLTRARARWADRLVMSKIRAGVGGRVRYLVSGSAPLPIGVAEFFSAIGMPIIEGYGLTETSPILTVNPPDAPRAETVGRAVSGVELRIAEDGEILARGPNVMQGYYNKPEATAAVLQDGWFHTGDVGTLDAEGFLRITDRKKDLIVTSGGKKVAPQPIEAGLARHPLIAEAVVLGDRRKFVSALLVPDFPALETRLRALGRPAATHADMVSRSDVAALYQEIVDALNRDLAQFEKIKKIALLPEAFSVASGELTPTLKVRRKVVEERWRSVIDQIYAS
ncbi:MAG TPA: long-chain fatty acid--CoA ligase [Vicinamibacterales bacterium]|nr:long-chain fatty acid--CoA ligase [Vicinamibacterales bacterium]